MQLRGLKVMTICKNCVNLIILLVIAIFMLSGCGGGNTTVQTVPAVIPSTTKVLDSTSINKLSAISADGAQLTFSENTSQVSSLSTGDIVTSGVTSSIPSGFLKKLPV